MLGGRSIIRGIYLGYFHGFIGLIISLALTPIILRYLGQSVYGLWAVFGSIVGYFGLFNFGLNTSITKYTAEYHAKNDQETLNKLISTIFVVFILIGVLIILISAALIPFIPRLLHLTPELIFVGRVVFLIMGLNAALGFLLGLFGNVIYGYQRVDVSRIVSIIQLTANALFTVIFLHLGFGLIGVVIAFSLSLLIAMFLCLLFIHRSGYGIVMHPRLADVKTLGNILPFSIRCFILGLTSKVLYYTDNIVISIFLGVSLVSSYSIAYRLSFMLATGCFIVLDTFFPRFTKLYASEDIDALKALYLRITKITVAITTPLALSLAIFGRSFIELWVGEANFVGIEVLLVFVAMNFIHSFAGPVGSLLQAIGKNKGLVYIEIGNAGLNFLLSIILVRRMGVLGVALGTLIAHSCTGTWIGPLLACRHIGLSARKFLLSGILPPLLVGVPTGIIGWMFIRNLFPNNYFYLGLKGALVIVIYGAIYLAIGATKEERQICLRIIEKGKAAVSISGDKGLT